MSNLKLCLNASTIMTTDIMTQIDVAQKTGFTALELWFDHIDDFINLGAIEALSSFRSFLFGGPK